MLDVCTLPLTEPPLYEVSGRRTVKADLSKAYALLARQKAEDLRRRKTWLAAHPDQHELPRRLSSTQVFLPSGGAELPATGLTELTEVTAQSGEMEVDEHPKEKRRTITQMQPPRPVEPAALIGPKPARVARGKKPPAVPPREKQPSTIKGLRERFPTLGHFAVHLSSTPRPVSTDSIVESGEEDKSSIEDDHRGKRQKIGVGLEGIRVYFACEEVRIPSIMATTMMERFHAKGAIVHDRLVLSSEDAEAYTTHVVGLRSDQSKAMTMKKVLRALDLRSEEALFEETCSKPTFMRIPLVVDQTWVSEALRYGRIAENRHLIPSKQVPVPLEFRPSHQDAEEEAANLLRSSQRSHIDSYERPAPLRYKASDQPHLLAQAEEQDGSGDESDSIEVPATGQQADEWDDLKEFFGQAKHGKDGDDEYFAPAPKAAGMTGFVIRPERKTADEDTDGEEAGEREAKAQKQSAHRTKRMQEEEVWACQRKSVYGGTRVACADNQRTVDVLGELAEDYDRVGDYWRLSTCRKVLGLVRNCTYPLNNMQKCINIRGIGDSMARKIVEIHQSGRLARLDNRSAADRASVLFARCHGIGPSEAGRFARAGARTLEDLKEGNPFGIRLNTQQELGLKYYEDLRNRMPREEAGAIHAIIEKRGKQLDPVATFDIMGSYRRGQPDCGDIDILVSRDTKDGNDHGGLVRQLIEQLFADGLLKHSLSEPHDWDGLDAKWMGLCSLPNGRMRRIDFLGVPHQEMPAALIYFTGNDIFNRSMRLKARKMGYSLNQRGLYRNLLRDPGTKLKVTDGEIMEMTCEKDIFDKLKVRWRPPTERLP